MRYIRAERNKTLQLTQTLYFLLGELNMTTLRIDDLNHSKELAVKTMANVQEGMFGLEGWAQTGAVQEGAGDHAVQFEEFQISMVLD
jgi:hypothetical protein